MEQVGPGDNSKNKRKGNLGDESLGLNIDPGFLAQPSQPTPIQENIENIRKIKEKYKPIEQASSITAFSYLMQSIPDGDIKQKLSDHISAEIAKNDENITGLNQKIHTMLPLLTEAEEFDRKCFNVLDSDDLKDSTLTSSINNILGKK